MYILDEDLNAVVAQSGIKDGHALVFVANVTAAVTTKPWVVITEPPILRSLLLGPSVMVPIVEGKPLLETWQNVILVECDTRDRARKVVYQIQGE